MKKVFEVVEYITGCVNAISKGFKIVADHWPSHNPFTDVTKKVSDGIKE
jgi:hypothetical protein